MRGDVLTLLGHKHTTTVFLFFRTPAQYRAKIVAWLLLLLPLRAAGENMKQGVTCD